MHPFHTCLVFCKRAVSVAIIFSGLLCQSYAADLPFLQDTMAIQKYLLKENSSNLPEIASLLAARMTYTDIWTVSGNTKRTIPEGNYSGIIVTSYTSSSSSLPDVIVGSGTVRLASDNSQLFILATPDNPRNDKFIIRPSIASPANLVIEQGEGTGNIRLNPVQIGNVWQAANLQIGDGKTTSNLPTITLTGRIDGAQWNAHNPLPSGYTSSLNIDGANFHLNGGMGTLTYMLHDLNVINGNLTVQEHSGITTNNDFNIIARTVSINSGFHIEVIDEKETTPAENKSSFGLHAYAINLPYNTYIRTVGEIDIIESLGDSSESFGGGSMVSGSYLESTTDHILFDKGITKAAGLIKAGRSINGESWSNIPSQETALAPFNQGGADALILEVTTIPGIESGDVAIGNANLDTITAGRDILSGTHSAISSADRVNFNLSGPSSHYFPRSTIIANRLTAKRNISAGEIILPRPGGKSSILEAGHLLVTKTPKNDSAFPDVSSGNFTLENGYFKLQSLDNLSYLLGNTNASLDYSSQIEGNMTVTDNHTSSFTTLNVGQTATISGGSIEGDLLVTNGASFDKITKTNIRNTLKVAADLTIKSNGASNIPLTLAGGKVEIGNGTYEGVYLSAKNAAFKNLTSLKLNGNPSTLNTKLPSALAVTLPSDVNLEAEDISIGLSSNGHANIDNANATKTFNVTNGEYTGNKILSGKNAGWTNSAINVTDFIIRGDLIASGNGASTIRSLSITGTGEISGGSLNVAKIITGSKTSQNSNFTIKDGSFTFATENPAEIHGSFTGSGLITGNFGQLNADKSISLSGGTVKGASIDAQSANFQNIAHLTLTDTLNIQGNAEISGSGESQIKDAKIKGNASISGGSYSGENISAKDASFNNLSLLALGGELTAQKISIDLNANGTSNINSINADSTLNLSGGEHTISTFVTGSDATLEGVKSLSVNKTASIGGNLTANTNGVSNFKQLEVDGNTNITGGEFSAEKITTGSATSSGGNFTIQNGSFNFGTDSNEASAIHGSLIATGNSYSTFGDLTVDDVLNISGGFLVGNSLHAGSGIFRNNAVVHIDNLIIDGAENGLTIEDNSMVVVKTVTDSTGNSLVSSGGLIILGDIEDPESWSTLPEVFNIEDSILRGEKALVRATDIIGQGHGDAVDDIQAYTLVAKNINIEDANLVLSGHGDYASHVEEDLSIKKNGQTRLGDLNVDGAISIEGGSVQARKLTSGKDAAFDNVELTLAGTGTNASSIGGDLTIVNNVKTSLGDISIHGAMKADGGTLEAGKLSVEKDAAIAGMELKLNGTQNNPGEIKGNLSLVENKSATLGALVVGENFTANKGTLNADILHIGQNMTMDDVEFSLNAPVDNPADVKGSVELKNNVSAHLGNIEVGKTLSASGGSLDAQVLKVTEDAQLSEVELTLLGTNERMGTIGGNLILEKNKTASLGVISIGENLVANDGQLSAQLLKVGGNAQLSDIEISLSGQSDNMDEIKGNLTLNNASTQAGYLAVNQSLAASGGSFKSSLIKVGRDATFSDVELELTGTVNNPDLIGGNFNISNNTRATLGHVQVDGTTSSSGGSINAHGLKTNVAQFVDGNINITNIETVKNADISGGKFTSSDFAADSTVFKNGVNANVNIMALAGEHKLLQIADASDSKGQTTVVIEHLNLAGGILRAGNIGVEPASLAIRAFTQRDGSVGNINGNIAVGSNSRVFIGTANTSWYSSGMTDSRAIFALAQPMRIGAGYGVHISGLTSPNPASGQIKFDASSLFVIDASNPRIYYTGEWIKSAQLSSNKGAEGALSAEQKAEAVVNTGAQIYIRNPVPNTVIVALGQNITTQYNDQSKNQKTRATSGQAWKDDNLLYDNADKVKIDRLEGEYAGQFSVVPLPKDNPEDPVNPDNPSEPENPDNPLANSNQPQDPGNAGHPDISAPGRIIVIGGTPQLALTANNAAATAMATRTALQGLAWRPDDIHARSISLWAMPIYKTSTGWNMDAGNGNYDFHGGIGGIAIGGDVTYEDILRAGLSFNIGGGFSKSGGDFAQTINNVNFWGLGAYALWAFGNFGLSADVNFTSSYNKLKQDGSEFSSWRDVKADAQAWVLAAGLKLEYRLTTDLLDIYPHLGVKYHYLNVDDYDIKSGGKTIMRGDSFNQNIWTFPVGIQAGKEFALENGWNLKPLADFRITPTAGDIEARTTSRLGDGSNEMTFHTQMMDYVTFGGSLGLEATKGDFTLGVNYNIEAGAKSVSNAIFGTIRYEF